MTKKIDQFDSETTAAGMGFGDLGMIRNILMGQFIAEYNLKFADIDDRLNANSAESSENLAALRAHFDQKLLENEQRVNSYFAKLESEICDKFSKLEKQISDNRRADKHALGKLFGTLAENLEKA